MVGPPRSQWAALYLNGSTLQQIASPAGVTGQTVANYLRLIGVKLRRKGTRKGSHWTTRERVVTPPAPLPIDPPAPIDPPLEYPAGPDDGYYGSVGY